MPAFGKPGKRGTQGGEVARCRGKPRPCDTRSKCASPPPRQNSIGPCIAGARPLAWRLQGDRKPGEHGGTKQPFMRALSMVLLAKRSVNEVKGDVANLNPGCDEVTRVEAGNTRSFR